MGPRKMMTTREFRILLSAGIVALISASCSHPVEPQVSPTQSPTPWTGLTENVRAVWSAQTGIDLVSGPAVAIRAYVESYSLAKDMGSLDVVYPGFARAVLRRQPNADIFTDAWPDTSNPAPHPIVGTEQRRILRIDNSGDSVVTIVCDYSTYTAGFDQEITQSVLCPGPTMMECTPGE